ncbi:hypothetical protein QQ045_031659 [Rhodiola kirilowii]
MDQVSSQNASGSNDTNVEQTEHSVDTQPLVKSGRLSSNVWNIFAKIETFVNGVKVLKAECSICGDVLNRGGSNGTTHLARHIAKHETASKKNENIKNQMLLGMNGSGKLQTFRYDNSVARRELVDFIIRGELPFTFVDTHDFKGMIQRAFAPQFSGFSSATCKRDVMKRFDACKSEMVKYFDTFNGKLSLTSDMWSSRQKMGYMSLTAHFIDKNWIMQKRILSFKMVEYPHSGETLANHAYEELIAWRINEKVFSITLDNASSNDILASVLPNLLMTASVNRQIFHVRCCCHILNLIVQDGLKILSPTIEKIVAIVRSMNSSIKRHEMWVHACSDLGLSKRNIDLDVPHRWNSTFDLLNVAMKYKLPLNRYVQKVNELRNCHLEIPSEQDWFIAQVTCEFLEIFNSSTKVCSGVYSPTSNRVVICLVDIYHTFVTYSHMPPFKSALIAMKDKFDKYWSSFPMIFCLATVMDPRFKMFAIEHWLNCFGIEADEVSLRLNEIRYLLNQLYDTYKREFTSSASGTAQSEPNIASESIVTGRVQNFSMQLLKRARLNSNTSTNTSDLNMYLELDVVEVQDETSFDILSWWKAHHETLYPILSSVAHTCLDIIKFIYSFISLIKVV